MVRKLLGVLSLLLSSAWWISLFKQGVEHLVWGHVLSFLEPYLGGIPLDAVIQYGPPILLAGAGTWLLWPKRVNAPKSSKNGPISLRDTTPAIHGHLQIGIGEGGLFSSTKAHGLWQTKRVLKLQVSNTNPSEAVSNCKIEVTKIEPEFGSGSWILEEGFSLNGGDRRFVPIASYVEGSSAGGGVSGHTVIDLCLPKDTPYLKIPLLEAKHKNSLTIRATGVGTSFCEVQCLLWVDSAGHLRIATQTSTLATRISLQDFLHEEAVKSGWGPRPGNAADLGDLIKKIRQAAVDGTLHLWGKQTHMAWHAQALDDAPLISIDKDYWREHEIDYLRAIFYDKGNVGTRSQHEFSESIDNPREPYYDLHLAREEALNWLRSPDGRP